MRQKIIQWLLGSDWEEYWKLHDKYIREIEDGIQGLRREKQHIITAEKLLREKYVETERVVELLEERIRILRYCIENNIDITEVLKEGESE